MKTNTKIGILIAVVIVIIAGALYFSSSSRQMSLETTKIRVANLPVVHGLPIYVAIEKGYFKQAGLDVELVPFQAPNQIIDAIMTGQVDFTSPSGALGITGIADYKNPGKLKIYAISGGSHGNSGADLIIAASSSLKNISELRGKKLGILAGTIQWRTIAREIMGQNNIDIDKDLTIVELAPAIQIQALASGQVDALLALEPIPTTAISKGVAKMLLADPTVTYFSDPSWLGAGTVNVNFAKENPHTTAKFIEIMNSTIAEINKNPDAYRQYLKGYTPLTDDLVTKVPLVSIEACGTITTQNESEMQKFFDIFTKNKVIDGNINVNNLLYCK